MSGSGRRPPTSWRRTRSVSRISSSSAFDRNGDDVVTRDELPGRMLAPLQLAGVQVPERMNREQFTIFFTEMRQQLLASAAEPERRQEEGASQELMRLGETSRKRKRRAECPSLTLPARRISHLLPAYSGYNRFVDTCRFDNLPTRPTWALSLGVQRRTTAAHGVIEPFSEWLGCIGTMVRRPDTRSVSRGPRWAASQRGIAMLTVHGQGRHRGRLLRRRLAPRLPVHRRHDARRPVAAAAAAPRRNRSAQLRTRRSSMSSCPVVRPTWTCGISSPTPARDSRRVQPDPHERPPASTSASTSRASAHGGQVHLHPLDGRLRRQSRRLPVHDRPQEEPAAGRVLAGNGRLGVASCKAPPTRPCRRTAR